ncbi:MAG: DUF6691 family protein [Candidatus Eisenbacteria bacterium]
MRRLVPYVLLGLAFGLVLTKAQVVSWFRIQEMFRFQGFHMFGVFALAMPVAILTVQALKRTQARALDGQVIAPPRKEMGRGIRYIAGGMIFGVGWALTGACPGPLFALLGAAAGGGVIAVAIAAALLGTWTYGRLRPRLPH